MTKKRKKKKKMSIIFIILLIISGIGGKYLMDKRTEHERQVAFLKEHEAEMTEYIKSQNEKIETVEYDWDSVEVGTIGNGTPQGGGILMSLTGTINGQEHIIFKLGIGVSKAVPKRNEYNYSWVTIYNSKENVETFAKNALIK
jgi:hypothetical protein